MKKSLIFLLAAALLICCASCGSKPADKEPHDLSWNGASVGPALKEGAVTEQARKDTRAGLDLIKSRGLAPDAAETGAIFPILEPAEVNGRCELAFSGAWVATVEDGPCVYTGQSWAGRICSRATAETGSGWNRSCFGQRQRAMSLLPR